MSRIIRHPRNHSFLMHSMSEYCADVFAAGHLVKPNKAKRLLPSWKEFLEWARAANSDQHAATGDTLDWLEAYILFKKAIGPDTPHTRVEELLTRQAALLAAIMTGEERKCTESELGEIAHLKDLTYSMYLTAEQQAASRAQQSGDYTE